jgi:hypothetical protein
LLVTDAGPGFERLARSIVGADLALECVDVPQPGESDGEARSPAADPPSERHRKIGA